MHATIANAAAVPVLAGFTICSDAVAERRRYEAAVAAFAYSTSPAGIAAYVASLTRAGFRVTKAAAREAARFTLATELEALGYEPLAIEWHAARRGRRERAAVVLH